MWHMSVFNQSTMEYVVDPNGGDDEGHATRDEAKRELQAWLLAEADSSADEDDASLLDDAAQRLNYAEFAQLGGSFDWTVETVEID
jgi:hypothetical protein